MSRTRLILLGLLAVLAVGVVASASATEPPVKCGGKVEKTPDYCVVGFELENAKGEPVSAKLEGTNSASILKATVAGATTEIKCGTGKTSGTIEDGAGGTVGKSTTTTTFEECKLLKPATCKLTAADEKEIKTTVLKGSLTLTGERVEDKFEPREGAFTAVNIEGKEITCPIAEIEKPESYNITGSQLCEIDTSNLIAAEEAEKHKIICKPAGSALLKIGGNKAEITSESTVKLMSAKKWSVKEDT
jgi:hypothetical protein